MNLALKCFWETGPRQTGCPQNSRMSSLVFIIRCPFCFQWRCPDSHRMYLRPKRIASARVQNVLFRGSSLLYSNMATCHTYNNTSRHNGVNRDFMAALSKSHGSTGKRNSPQSTNRNNAIGIPKSAPNDKTPCSTPRSLSSETSSSSLASKPASVKKSAFSRLKRFLMLEDNQKTKGRTQRLYYPPSE
uniref:Uncharacterized protein n=1 Tax=Oncorhynchus tshawytscha TaxID=74940 RepID=A0AAZ3PUW5_ONCTS